MHNKQSTTKRSNGKACRRRDNRPLKVTRFGAGSDNLRKLMEIRDRLVRNEMTKIYGETARQNAFAMLRVTADTTSTAEINQPDQAKSEG